MGTGQLTGGYSAAYDLWNGDDRSLRRDREPAVSGALAAFAALAVFLQPAYTTFHFDNRRSGWNNRETMLVPARMRDVRMLARFELDGEVDAQPLYHKGVAFVVTDNDTLYAISPTRGLLWKRHFGTAVAAAYAGRCRATAPSIGIQSTPVIDPASGTIYLVTYTLEHGVPAYTLRAVSTASGAERRRVDISKAVGNTYVHRQRAGLLESGGTIYIGFAGFCDHNASTTYGRMLAYSARDLAFAGSFVTTSSPACVDVHMGTIWSMGFAPAADARGNVYFATGNGCIDYSRVPDGGYSDAVLRLT
ncbi:MAG TPA: PQQ-binding-like beta-propeller repeat protein, partial [Candidatus Baltobacteraceae bacterium]|nr:PQQ-binding-like beta-propeller repeat protein [Candidatus Baltobacteraceae bacterium]